MVRGGKREEYSSEEFLIYARLFQIPLYTRGNDHSYIDNGHPQIRVGDRFLLLSIPRQF